MMAIFDAVADGNVIDVYEFRDIEDIVGNAEVSMPAYVRNLADKVINGDMANTRFQGEWTEGNIEPGSTFTRLDNLVDKWFLGLDRPATPYEYQYIQGSLFQDGISYA